MTATALAAHFTAEDWAALLFLIIAWAGIGRAIEHPPASRPSVAVLMAEYRREWMRQLVTRQPRIFDATVLDSLRQSTAFFASACMIAIGGGVALLGNAERVVGMGMTGTAAPAAAFVLQVKMLAALLFVVNAFLKFVWANRLFGYCAILMAAVPNDPDHPAAYPRAAQAAEVNITAARSFNRGLHSVYFALAMLAWLLGPLVLALAVPVASAVQIRREFASTSRAAILNQAGAGD
ncbi:MAG: DUF599 domain-containing protein [Gemmobacter sp.]